MLETQCGLFFVEIFAACAYHNNKAIFQPDRMEKSRLRGYNGNKIFAVNAIETDRHRKSRRAAHWYEKSNGRQAS